MKEEDRLEACESLQEIETDLIYQLIESYQRQDINNVIDALNLLRPLLDINREICGQYTK